MTKNFEEMKEQTVGNFSARERTGNLVAERSGQGGKRTKSEARKSSDYPESISTKTTASDWEHVSTCFGFYIITDWI